MPGGVSRQADEDHVRIAKRWFGTQGFDVETWRHEGQWIARARVGQSGEELIGRGATEVAAMSELQRRLRAGEQVSAPEPIGP